MLGLEPVESVLAELRDDPAPDLRLIGAVQRSLGDRPRRDCREPCLEPVSDSERLTCLASQAGVALAF